LTCGTCVEHSGFNTWELVWFWCIPSAVQMFRLSVAILMLLVCYSVVQKRPDQCHEAAWLGATVTRWVLGNNRSVEAGVGAWCAGASEPRLSAGTHCHCEPVL